MNEELRGKLRTAIYGLYGDQCRRDINAIEKRLEASIAALLFAGEEGDNILCRLNRLFKEVI